MLACRNALGAGSELDARDASSRGERGPTPEHGQGGAVVDVLSTTTGGSCGTLCAAGQPRPIGLDAKLVPPFAAREPPTASHVVACAHSTPRTTRRAVRSTRNCGGKLPSSCHSLRFSAAQRPSAPASGRTALQSSRKRRAAAARAAAQKPTPKARASEAVAPRARINTKTKNTAAEERP